ncbi:MAG TPA: YIP1 family protein [Pseudomonadales bacterium]
MQGSLPFSIIFDPAGILRALARSDSAVTASVRAWLPLLLLLPPASAAIGGILFGWRLGTAEPLYLDFTQSITISLFYLLALCFGFFSTAMLARWMAQTYGANASLQTCAALLTVVSAPLAVAGLSHLYPHVFLNVLVLIPAVIWSMTLLYRGLPVALGIPPERGMLMSSALVGWLLVAAVSLLGISAGLWTAGLGPAIRI